MIYYLMGIVNEVSSYYIVDNKHIVNKYQFLKTIDCTTDVEELFNSMDFSVNGTKKSLFKKYTFLKYEELDTIESERQFQTGDIVKLTNNEGKDEEWEIKYRYNNDLKRHELLIDKVITTIEDMELLQEATIKLVELNTLIEHHSQTAKVVTTPLELEEETSLGKKIKKLLRGK